MFNWITQVGLPATHTFHSREGRSNDALLTSTIFRSSHPQLLHRRAGIACVELVCMHLDLNLGPLHEPVCLPGKLAPQPSVLARQTIVEYDTARRKWDVEKP